LSIDDYCTKLERLFVEEMQQSESHQSSAKQKAWIEKAKSTIAHLQGDRKIQAFFNFTAAVSDTHRLAAGRDADQPTSPA
jgi:hypothetical protein